MSEAKETKTVVKSEPKFTKAQLLNAKRFTGQEKDVLAAVLEDGVKYSLTDVDKQVKAFKAKEAK